MAPVLTKNKSGSENEDSNSSADIEPRRKKTRTSRWVTSDKDPKAFIPGMPTIIPPNMTKEQEKAYLTQLRIEEITRSLRTGDLGIPTNPENRSPSPEPIYDSNGKRLNTREVRARTKLEGERHKLILEMLKCNPEYKPPADYKPPANKIVDKVFIPQEEYPDINFVGLLIGPRGNTLKKLEQDSGAKIIIRGKGSIKEGKIGRKDGQPLPGEDEPLHAYITGSSIEVVKKACEKVRDIVQQGIELPENMNDLRKSQLRELALLNGTLRENDSLNKLRILAQADKIVTNTIICAICGGAGHITSDCKSAKSKDSSVAGTSSSANDDGSSSPAAAERPATWAEREKMDSEYHSLMAELGQGPAVDSKSAKSGKSIVPRGGASSSGGHNLAIESGNGGGGGSFSKYAPKSSSSNNIIDSIPEEDRKTASAPSGAGPAHGTAQHPQPTQMPPAMDPQAAMMQQYYAQYYAQYNAQYMWPGYAAVAWPGTGASAVPPPPPPPPPPSS